MRQLRATVTVIVLILLCLLALPSPAAAGPVLPEPVSLVQPDGTPLDAMPYGDEWNNGYETLDGYTIIQDPATGVWSYAQADGSGVLVPSGMAPGDAAPEGLSPHLRGQGLSNPNRLCD